MVVDVVVIEIPRADFLVDETIDSVGAFDRGWAFGIASRFRCLYEL